MSFAANGKTIYKIKDKQTSHTVLQKLSPKACNASLTDISETFYNAYTINPLIPGGTYMVHKKAYISLYTRAPRVKNKFS